MLSWEPRLNHRITLRANATLSQSGSCMPTRPSADIGQLLDGGGWGGYQRRLVLLTALTIIFDGIDNQLMGVTVPTLMREWSVPRAAFAPVLSLGYLGMRSFGTNSCRGG